MIVLVLVLGAVAGCCVGLYVGFHSIWLAMLVMDFGGEEGQAVAKGMGRFQIFEIHLPTFLQASNETRSILKNFYFLLSLAFLMNSTKMLNRSCSSKYGVHPLKISGYGAGG